MKNKNKEKLFMEILKKKQLEIYAFLQFEFD